MFDSFRSVTFHSPDTAYAALSAFVLTLSDIPHPGRRENSPTFPVCPNILLRQPERPSLPDQLRHVLVHDAAAALDGVSARDDELGPAVPYLLERAALAILGLPFAHDGHRHLNVGVAHFLVLHDEVALELADAPHTHLVAQALCVAINDVLQHRPVVDAVVRVERKVEAQVGEVVLLLALERLARLHVEARALADDLGILEYLEVAVERLALDADALPLEIGLDVRQRARSPRRSR